MTLTSQQISYLQAELTANDVAGFYALLDSYGDTYGRLGLGVTNNDTWQGQIANAFAESAASDNTANMQYGSQDWTSVNSQLAQEYLDLYTDNSGDQPTWQQIQSIHNDVYQNNDLDPNDWFPNKMLDDAILPGNLWQDWQENTNALDVWEDVIGIASSAGALDFVMLINGTPVLNTSPTNVETKFHALAGSNSFFIEREAKLNIEADSSSYTRNSLNLEGYTTSDFGSLEFRNPNNDLEIFFNSTEYIDIEDQFTSTGNAGLLKVLDSNDDVIFSYDLRYLDAATIGSGRTFVDILAAADPMDDAAAEEASDFLDKEPPSLPSLPDVDVPEENFAEELANHAFWADKYSRDVLNRGLDPSVGIDQAKLDLAQGIADLVDAYFPLGVSTLADFLNAILNPLVTLGNILPLVTDIANALANYADNETFVSPLVLDLDSDGIELVTQANGVYWDIDEDGFAEASGWIGADDGFLAIDLNSDGIINDNGELFGNGTTDGFTVLSSFDTNSDTIINSSDAQFADLLVWQDVNSDGLSQASELFSLADLGITSIDLSATQTDYYSSGHYISHEGSFTMNGVSYDVHDIWFSYDNGNSRYVGDYDLDIRTLFMPTLRGYGDVPDLHVAMSLNEDLLDDMALIASKSMSANALSKVSNSWRHNHCYFPVILKLKYDQQQSASAFGLFLPCNK